LSTSAAAQDPFQAGLRWTLPADASAPSIPKSIAFSARCGLVWTASNGAHPNFRVASGFESGTVQPLFGDFAPLNATGAMAVAAGRDGEALFSLVQVPAPDALNRATLVSRYSAVSAASGAPFAPQWTYDPGSRVNGPAKVACDAGGVHAVVAVWSDQTHTVQVDVLDAATGLRTSRADVAGLNLSEIALAGDGSRCAVSAGLDLWVLDTNGATVHHETLANSTSALAISGDGKRLAIGGRSALRVLQDDGAGYQLAFTVPGASSELSARAALSANGETLAVGWWNASTGVDLRFEVWDVATHARSFELVQTGVPGGLQNLPEVVRVTADGKRAALGAWGDGTSKPDVVVFDRDLASVVFAVDLPGSVFALDLDEAGRKIAVGLKNTHANLFATSGQFRMYDTGESDLQVLHAAHAGGTLDLAAHRVGATGVFFLDGSLAPQPFAVPGIAGLLRLKRAGLSAVRRPADATGRADVMLPIANDPALIGTYRHLQAAFRTGAAIAFGAVAVDVLIL
jgi:hypothetical protein